MVKLPSLSDLVVVLLPWSLTASMVISAHGFPATSNSWPLMTPSSCAEARGATAQTSATTNSTANTKILFPLDRHAVKSIAFIPHSPLPQETSTRKPPAGTRLLSPFCGGFQVFKTAPTPRAGKKSDRGRPLQRRPAVATSNYRKHRRPNPAPDSTTKLDATAHPIRCRGE